MLSLEASDSILAFERSTRAQQLLCVFNLGTQARAWQPPGAGHWRIIECSEKVEPWTLPGLTGCIAERNA